jgi:hypothetical protein
LGPYILPGLLVFAGAVFTLVGYSQVVVVRKRFATWVRAQGTVVALVARGSSSRGSTLYAPQYRYAFLGREHTATGDVASAPPGYGVGDPIRLLVNPARADESAVVDGSTTLFSYGILILGAVVLALGFVFTWLAATGWMENR